MSEGVSRRSRITESTAALAAGLMVVACAPTVAVQAPAESTTIAVNLKIEHVIRVGMASGWGLWVTGTEQAAGFGLRRHPEHLPGDRLRPPYADQKRDRSAAGRSGVGQAQQAAHDCRSKLTFDPGILEAGLDLAIAVPHPE